MKHTPRRNIFPILVLCLCLIPSFLPGQTEPATPAAPAQNSTPQTVPAPVFSMHMDGPEKLRVAFLPTNLGTFLAGEEARTFLTPAIQMLDMLDQQSRAMIGNGEEEEEEEEGAANHPGLKEILINYSGRLVLSGYLLGEGPMENENRTPKGALVLSLAPDGNTDLSGLAMMLSKMLEATLHGEAGQLNLDDREFPVLTSGGGDNEHLLLPFMQDEQLFCAMADSKDNLQLILAHILHSEAAAQPNPNSALHRASFGATLDVEQLMARIEEDRQARLEEAGAEWSRNLLHVEQLITKFSGVLSVDRAEFSLFPQGADVVQETSIQFNQQPRHFIGCLLPKDRLRTPLLDSMPRAGLMASSFYVDGAQILEVFRQGAKEAPQESDRDDIEEMEANFTEETGLRLKEDFLQLMTPECLYYQTFNEEDAEDMEDMPEMSMVFRMLETYCLGVQLKDAKTFSMNLATAMVKSGAPQGQAEDYKGYQVYSNPAGFFNLYYAITDNLLLIGAGSESYDPIKAVLDMEAARRDGKEPQPLPHNMQTRLPKGQDADKWGGFAYVNTGLGSSMFSLMTGFMQGAVGPGPNSPLNVLVSLQTLLSAEVLKEYQLDYQILTTQTRGNSFIIQNRL